EDWVIVGGATVIHQFVRVGRHAMVGGGSRIVQDIAPFVKAAGSPPRLAGVNTVGLARRGFSTETCDAIRAGYRALCRDGLTVDEAVARIRSAHGTVAEVEHLARF